MEYIFLCASAKYCKMLLVAFTEIREKPNRNQSACKNYLARISHLFESRKHVKAIKPSSVVRLFDNRIFPVAGERARGAARGFIGYLIRFIIEILSTTLDTCMICMMIQKL